MERDAAGCHAKLFLDRILALLAAAPHCFDEARFLICDLLKLFFFGCLVRMRVSVCSCTLQHVMLLLLQHLRYLLRKLLNRCGNLFACISAHDHCHTIFDILRSKLNTHRNSAHLLLREFPSRALLGIVEFHAKSALCKCFFNLVCFFQNALLLLTDRNDHNLRRCNMRRKHQSAVVAVYHDDRSDHTGRHTPGSLMNVFQLVIFVCKLNAECLCKSIAKIVAGTGLQCFSVMHQGLDRVCRLCTGKFLFVCLASLDNRDCQHLLTEICINVQHLDSTCLCLLCGRMCSMSLLPQELSGTQERSRRLLPSHDRAPLIIDSRKVTIGMDIILIKITEQCL